MRAAGSAADRGPPPARARRGAGALVAAGVALLAAIPAAEILLAEPEPGGMRRSVLAGAAAVAWLAAFLRLGRPARLRAAAAALALVAALGLAEAVLRVTIGPSRAPLYRQHPDWLYEHVPGRRRVQVSAASGRTEAVPFEVNSEGFRGPELRARGGQKRVVVYGDSFVAAPATREENTFTVRLGEALRAAGIADVETVNAGVVGYGPAQIALRMDTELPRLSPDLVVVSILGENDYGDLLRDRIFEITPEGSLVRRRPKLWEGLRDFLDETQGRALLAVLWDDAVERLRRGLNDPPAAGDPHETERWLGACEFGYRVATDAADLPVADLFLDHPDEDVRVLPGSPSARHKVRMMERVLAEVAAVAARHRVPLVAMVVPAAIDVCEDYDRDRVDIVRFPQYRPTNLTDPIERALDAAGVPYVSLFAPFRIAGANSLYFHGGDTHWNDAGQALAARLVAEFVTKRGILR